MRPASFPWFGRHEARLAWRETISLLTGGRRRRKVTVFLGLGSFVLIMHLVALAVISPADALDRESDRHLLLLVSGFIVVSWSLMLSQAIEAVTRAFYARGDFDLILASPAPAARLFAVRIVAVAFSIMTMALVMAAPFVNVLIYRGGPKWFGGYGVLAAMGFSAAALGVVGCVALFRTIGPRRARFVAQIVAAVVGAGFVIGLQLAAILSFGEPGQPSPLRSEWLASRLPDDASPLWWPARAALGDPGALAIVLGLSAMLLLAVAMRFARAFGEHAILAGGVAEPRRRNRKSALFRSGSMRQVLRRKEWMLLRRDPWLASQTLMQLLYLLPPAFLLWKNLGSGTSPTAVAGPVLVMAAGQFAGGLAWLAVSGEDAPELIASAPASPRQVIRAKVESVVLCVLAVFGPMVLLVLPAGLLDAVMVAAGIAVSAGSATMIQLWFRRQAKRSTFRRRQTSSRLATIAEAFSSIGWAGTTGLLAAGSWFALPAGLVSLVVVFGVWLVSPRGGGDAEGSAQTGKAGSRPDPAMPRTA